MLRRAAAGLRPWQRYANSLTRSTQHESVSNAASCSTSAAEGEVRWVFLGPPGVGKGTYASRVARALGVPHIAAGDLVRAEIKSGSALGQEMKATVDQGKLLSDDTILKVLEHRLESGQQAGERGFLLDGFPRTLHQAQQLLQLTPVGLALNMSLREEVLLEKCLGRRMCSKCGNNYNIADIRLAASGDRPEIVMPPLSPPEQCRPYMEIREDDKEEVVRRRLQAYREQAEPVEDFFRQKGLLLDFEITGGIPETLPRLMETLAPYHADNGSGQEAPQLQEHTA